ncbi:cell wall metabolism sensor histidine kinase WalK [Amycolatopsis sp. Poz14]|uniref:sensor histidine kinase n=1 Tax=Amycolatopsis sp. Poz14 TaxID=1447705 RepID=UPI001EE783DA|nr:HAMP domain-containing sensor histidine kinase [Amycolatopsis sp. Poz14]MCG3754094.1 HAMP domain-containing histidine kinase [Amycolatopsis sp. Poz14]
MSRPPASTEARLLRRATWRLGLQVGLSVAAIVVLLSGLAVLMVLRSQQTGVAALLQQAASQADDVQDPPAGVWLAIQGPGGLTATPGAPAVLPDRAALANVAKTGTAQTDEVRGERAGYEVYTEQRGTQTVQAALDLRANNDERERLLAAMLFSGGVGLLLAVGAGVWFGRRAVAPLATALGMQRRFVADASHELRTPLTLLSTRVQVLRRHLRRGDSRERLTAEIDGVVADAGHLTDILEDLLLAADVRADGLTATLDLVELAARAAAAGTPAAAERSIVIEARPTVPTLLVRGTQGGLLRAVTALVDNAVTHARSAVTITTKQTGTTGVVEVSDDGPGIDPAVLPGLFERFSSARPESSPRRHYGLGLALVSEIADRHGGHVTAGSNPGGGALLTLTLPLAGRDPRAASG